MSFYRRSIAALAGALTGVLAMGTAFAQSAAPTASDLTRALSSRASVVRTQIGRCTPGTMQGIEVSVCRYCLTWIAIAYGRSPTQQGSVLQVRQGPSSITFQRAVSHDQPNVQPLPGRQGVWVAVGTQGGPNIFMTESVPRDMWSALGYTPISGMAAYSEAAMSDRVWGGRLPRSMTNSLQRDAALRERVTSLMPACAV